MFRRLVIVLLLASCVQACNKPAEPVKTRTAAERIRAGIDLINMQDREAARRVLKSVLDDEPNNYDAWFFYGFSLHVDGRLDEALEAHIKASNSPLYKDQAMYNAACVYALRNDNDKALEWLEKSFNAGPPNFPHMALDSDLDNLRNDPRF